LNRIDDLGRLFPVIPSTSIPPDPSFPKLSLRLKKAAKRAFTPPKKDNENLKKTITKNNHHQP